MPRPRSLAGGRQGAKLADALIVGVVLSWGLGLAEQSADHNGGYGKNLTTPARLAYVERYIDSMQISSKKLLRVAAELLDRKAAKGIFGHADREIIISGWSPDELMRYLDKVYIRC